MNTAIDNVYAIILAAGASSRMGSSKQLLEWRNRPLLEYAVANARAVLNERVIVVLGAHAESIQTTVDLNGVTSIVNSDWQEGMASSIRAGVRALPESASAALILLCDQPLINAAHMQNLLNNWQNAPARIVASQYHHSVGVPALFPAEFFEHLLTLKGDRGAKPVLMKFEDSLLKIPLPEAELDIDSAGDFDRLTAHYSVDE
ncbi:MAG: nucleotidyltransferase family protein [Methylobacter sp.]